MLKVNKRNDEEIVWLHDILDAIIHGDIKLSLHIPNVAIARDIIVMRGTLCWVLLHEESLVKSMVDILKAKLKEGEIESILRGKEGSIPES